MVKGKKIAKKLGNFVEQKRQQAIVNITNSTATGMLLKWIFTHKVVVILSLILALGYGWYRYETNYLRELADKNRIIELQEDLAEELAQTEKLLKEIEEFNRNRSSGKEISEKVKRRTSSLSAQEKKRVLLQYRDRLMEKRGLQ